MAFWEFCTLHIFKYLMKYAEPLCDWNLDNFRICIWRGFSKIVNYCIKITMNFTHFYVFLIKIVGCNKFLCSQDVKCLADILKDFQNDQIDLSCSITVIARRKNILQSACVALSRSYFAWHKLPHIEFVGEMALWHYAQWTRCPMPEPRLTSAHVWPEAWDDLLWPGYFPGRGVEDEAWKCRF